MLNNSILNWFIIYWLLSELFVYINITNFLVALNEGNDKVIEKFGKADEKELVENNYKDTNEFLDYIRDTISIMSSLKYLF